MERDIKFEVQYLLALTLVVFGLLSINIFSDLIEAWIAYAVVAFLSMYFAVFNLYYGYGQALDFDIDFVDRMEENSGFLLFLVSMSFTYFILHWLASMAYAALIAYDILNQFQYQHAGEIFIELIVPLLIIAPMGYSFKENVENLRRRFSNINIKIIPQEVRILSTPEDSKPFTVKVENLGDEEFEFDLFIKVPEGVYLHLAGDDYPETFETSVTVSPQRQYRETFGLSYDGDERHFDEIEITVSFDGGSKEETISADLVAQ